MADEDLHELDDSTLPLGLRRASSTFADMNLLDNYDQSSETLRDSPEPFVVDDDEHYGLVVAASDSIHSYGSRNEDAPSGYPHNLLNVNDSAENAYRVTPDFQPNNHDRISSPPSTHSHPHSFHSRPSTANRNSQQTIDLTSDSPDSDSDIMPPKRGRKRTIAHRESTAASASAGPSTKRTKTTPSKEGRKSQENEEPVEAIDLVEDTPLAEALQKQRAEQVKAQQEPTEKPVRLSNLSCVICMDRPEDLTATSCGLSFLLCLQDTRI